MGIYDMNSYNAETYIVKKLKNNKDTIILEFTLSGKINKDFDSIRIEVAGLDKRRFNIYRRSLIPLGYNLNTSSGISYLYKDIKRK